MKFRQTVCVIVDAYSTGNTLPGIFSGYGYPSIHVQSSDYIPPLLKNSFREKDFFKTFYFNGDLDALCKEFEALHFKVKCVVPGAECGVMLADALSEKLGVPTNGTEFSKTRRDKFLMIEALQRAGVHSVRHFKSNSLETIIAWAIKNVLPEPVVLKPIASSSTDGFHICHNESEIEVAFNDIFHSENIFGKINEEILVQNYLDGQEYCVNMVSHDGQHYLSEIWRVNKRISGYSKVYDSEYLVVEGDEEYLKLVEYAKSVLNALRIQYGPSHSEIIITKEGVPTLVESAARMMGSIDLSLITEARSTNAALLTAESYLMPELFMRRFENSRSPAKKIPCMVQLLSTQSGKLLEFNLEGLRRLKTFHGMDTFVDPGAKLSLTVDTRSSVGRVFLMGDTLSELHEDYCAIREMEKNGEIYIVERRLESQSLASVLVAQSPIFSSLQSVQTTAVYPSAILPDDEVVRDGRISRSVLSS